MPRCRRAESERGAAAVEAALTLAFLLVPLLLGILYWGQYFWHAQRTPSVDLELPGHELTGSYCTEQELVDRVYSLLGGNVSSLADQLGLPLGIDDFTVSVVSVLPTVGADLRIRVAIPVLNQVAPFLPLPNGGNLIHDLTVRLDDVVVGTGSC